MNDPSEFVVIRKMNQGDEINSLNDFNIFVNKMLTYHNLDRLIIMKIPTKRGIVERNDIYFHNSDIYLSLFNLINFNTWNLLSPLHISFMPYIFQFGMEPRKGDASDSTYLEFTVQTDPLERIFLTQTRAVSGCCIPFMMPKRGKALALFSGSTAAVMPNLGALFLLVMNMADYLSSLRLVPENTDRNKLNPREIECLGWVAAGKTSNEIANITSLSEHTVNHYLQVCCKKLDAVNRIQAAVAATRMGWI